MFNYRYLPHIFFSSILLLFELPYSSSVNVKMVNLLRSFWSPMRVLYNTYTHSLYETLAAPINFLLKSLLNQFAILNIF